jgi:CRP/FNR family transcriptional regulator, cyclic AMP receptor protein
MGTRPGGLVVAESLQDVIAAPRRSVPRISAAALRQISLFEGLSDRQRKRVARLATMAEFREGTSIVREGTRAHSFFVVVDGRARVERGGVVTASLVAGDGFGEMALLDGEPRSASVVAETDVAAVRIAADPFRALLRREPAIAIALLRTLSLRVRRLEGASGATPASA